ncbi:MAG: hypothetical protein BMS9Abin02_0514 [Anaerolineae bacterium]|nr:MAG: hypothetical protein BMS9Abin02_0514 [Anaerolineae bacterium]
MENQPHIKDILSQMKVRNLISRREWLAAISVAVGLTIILALPYVLGYAFAGPDLTFTGILMNPEDTQSYFAKMLQGYDGQWLYRIPFTVEEHDPALLGGLYPLLGHIARLFGLSLDAIWNLSRFISSVILFVTTFAFIATYLPDRRERWSAYLLAILGSGLGWLLFIINQPYWLGAFPVDFKMPEAHLFFSALTFPHGMLGTALLLASFVFIKKALNSNNGAWLFAILAGLSNLLLGIIYPFLIYLIAVTYGVYWLFRLYLGRRIEWLDTGLLAVALIIPLPLYIYYYYTYQVNEIFRTWADQAVTTSPAIPHFIIAYGPLLLLALLPLFINKKKGSNRGSTTLLWSWIIAASLLIYAPINPQRRFVQGVQVPLSILGAIGIYQVFLPWLMGTRLFQRVLNRPRYSIEGLERLTVVAIIAILALSNIYVLASMSITAAIQKPYPFFREKDEVAAVEWLRNQDGPRTAVISAYETGNFIGARAGKPVLVGHWAETAFWEDKLDKAMTFYQDETSDRWRIDLLDQYGIGFVWYGTMERLLGDFDPLSADYLFLVYSHGDVNIYGVR